MVCVIGGLQKSGKFMCSGDTFGGCWLLFNFDDSYNTKVWSVDHIIIFIYINGVCYMGVFQNVPNSRAVVTLLEAVGYC